MKESSTKQYNFMFEVFKNTMTGVAAVTAATPGFVWTNYLLSNKPFFFRNIYQGYSTYILGIVPTTVVALSAKSYLHQYTQLNTMVCSGLAGALSAFPCTPFEALAQNKQTQQKDAWILAQKVIKEYGIRRLFTGNLSIMLRQMVFVPGYLNLIPIFKNWIGQQINLRKNSINLIASFGTGIVVGVATTPIHCLLRHGKQEAIMNSHVPSYFDLVSKACNFAKSSHLKVFKTIFRGILPRTASCVIAITSVSQATQLCEQLSPKGVELS